MSHTNKDRSQNYLNRSADDFSFVSPRVQSDTLTVIYIGTDQERKL